MTKSNYAYFHVFNEVRLPKEIIVHLASFLSLSDMSYLSAANKKIYSLLMKKANLIDYKNDTSKLFTLAETKSLLFSCSRKCAAIKKSLEYNNYWIEKYQRCFLGDNFSRLHAWLQLNNYLVIPLVASIIAFFVHVIAEILRSMHEKSNHLFYVLFIAYLLFSAVMGLIVMACLRKTSASQQLVYLRKENDIYQHKYHDILESENAIKNMSGMNANKNV